MKTDKLTRELLHNMDAYSRAPDCLSVGQIDLYGHESLKRPLEIPNAKHMLLGHRGTTADGTSFERGGKYDDFKS